MVSSPPGPSCSNVSGLFAKSLHFWGARVGNWAAFFKVLRKVKVSRCDACRPPNRGNKMGGRDGQPCTRFAHLATFTACVACFHREMEGWMLSAEKRRWKLNCKLETEWSPPSRHRHRFFGLGIIFVILCLVLLFLGVQLSSIVR